MVGASVIGELAWSVENMLNQVIDGSVFMNDDIAALLQDVTDTLPELTADFEKHRTPSVATAPLEERANALAKGEIPAGTPAPGGNLADETTETGARQKPTCRHCGHSSIPQARKQRSPTPTTFPAHCIP
jgi:chemosensory pili system protein ChpA (sensor histidine kinase/response regulator)